ncbi:MAG TPA: SPOR domain-containing protein, partial [Thermopetrobacter sp.]|nr:SPOR domain-containing protein [Thermopetrobacter sp.]
SLGNLAPLIYKKDLGDLGIFYRLAVGTLASRNAARQLCTRLIARGVRDCLVRTR